MSVLTNDICDLEILNRAHLLFDEDRTVKKLNLLSSTFFKREAYYKNFGIYVKGLRRVIEMLNDYNENIDHQNDINTEPFYYLIFIDKHVSEDRGIMRTINSSEYVIPILFKCSEYIKNDYHIDLFGTLVRFFPMFDFLNNPSKCVICIDVDLNREDRRKVTSLMRNIPPGVTGSGEIHRLIYAGETPYVFAGTLMFNRDHMPNELITKFIRSAHSITGTGHYGKRTTTFGYGIDEMFLNGHLLPAVKTYSVMIEYQISYFLYHSASYIAKQKRSESTYELLKLILKELYSPDMTIDSMIDLIESSYFVSDIKRMIRRQSRQEAYDSVLNVGEVGGVDDVDETETESQNLGDVELPPKSVSYKILRKLLGKRYDSEMSINDMMRLVDESTYNVLEKNPINNSLAERFYYVIHDLLSRNKKWLEPNVMNLIDQHLRNIISAVIIFDIDPDKREIVDVKTYDVVYTDEII